MSGIVIIEDDALMRSLMAEWLMAEGYRVNASRVNDACAASADLVIVDVYMRTAAKTCALGTYIDAAV